MCLNLDFYKVHKFPLEPESRWKCMCWMFSSTTQDIARQCPAQGARCPWEREILELEWLHTTVPLIFTTAFSLRHTQPHLASPVFYLFRLFLFSTFFASLQQAWHSNNSLLSLSLSKVKKKKKKKDGTKQEQDDTNKLLSLQDSKVLLKTITACFCKTWRLFSVLIQKEKITASINWLQWELK